ncbi:MAG: hypothetical protein HON68_05545 [Gammaproteobacteria bacterium]|jgi:vacuolar-type H+-ATPase subunit F/Vma7|nr:hypothetical protein [Gammaproteobacteria bacterium]MBT3488337.1 hypothetical protein [Gammaproteobacteria bacterium]MBT3717382.1 hypothetical protein [Gammaproteobacteria bacterium]MBT3845629.1 hypothetical protein [Gammaproteobacteria bacterium]MBT3892309.1 hypothetical protein [Gammaproteobacteria bacterium]
MRIIAIGSAALMDGFSLLGIETHADLSVPALEQLLDGIVTDNKRTLIYLEQGGANTELPSLQKIRNEGGNILISELPQLNTPEHRDTSIDALITRVIGSSALGLEHE